MGKYFNITEAAIDVRSDFESGLKRTLLSTDKTLLYYNNDSHLDLINAMNNICRKSSIKITGRHVHIRINTVSMIIWTGGVRGMWIWTCLLSR